MTTKFIDQMIRQNEGFRPNAYPDPKTGADPWTVGFGCTGPGIVKGTMWTLAQSVSEQVKRRQQFEVSLDRAIPWWRQLSDERQDVLTDMAYQMGTEGLMRFPHMLRAAQAGDYEAAADEILDSDYAREDAPKRAKRNADQMRSGVITWMKSTANFGQAATQAAVNNA